MIIIIDKLNKEIRVEKEGIKEEVIGRGKTTQRIDLSIKIIWSLGMIIRIGKLN